MLEETETHAPRKEQARQHRGTRDQLYTMRMHVNWYKCNRDALQMQF